MVSLIHLIMYNFIYCNCFYLCLYKIWNNVLFFWSNNTIFQNKKKELKKYQASSAGPNDIISYLTGQVYKPKISILNISSIK